MTETAITEVTSCNNRNWLFCLHCNRPVAELQQTLDFEREFINGVKFKQCCISSGVMFMKVEGIGYLAEEDDIIYID